MQTEQLRTQAKRFRASDKLQIASVSFLNSVAYQPLANVEGVEYSEFTPSECSTRLHENECDLALIPIAEFVAHGGYQHLSYGICSRGNVKSVALFSHCDIEQIETIVVDGTSRSSVLLLKLILAAYYPKVFSRVRFCALPQPSLSAHVKNHVGALVIGDEALRLQGKFATYLDLGEHWQKLTGLPFVFALWAHRPNAIESSLQAQIEEGIIHGIDHRAVLARAKADTLKLDREIAESYIINNIHFEIDDQALAGAREFVERAASAGYLPKSNLAKIFSLSRLKLSKHANETKEAFVSSRVRSLDSLLQDASNGERISMVEALCLTENATLADLSIASELRRKAMYPADNVSYIVDRNINYTNVCNVYCRFCAFYSAPGKEGGYLLTKEQIGKKIEETVAAGGIQILLQGGLNPELGIEYYEDLFRWIKDNYPINLHALSSDEILHISRVSNLSIEETLQRLIAAGLGSLPGGGGEILVDRVRFRIAKLKSNSADWLEVHRVAHRLGLTSTCTMMFGVQENWEDRINHLHKLRSLQDESGGFTAFISWPFQDENTRLKKGNTSPSEYLRVQAIARLFLDNIPGLQSSWVTMGPAVGQVALLYGANDFGSVMFEENVVSSAGTVYCMDSLKIEQHIINAGFTPWRRNVHYEPVGGELTRS